MVFFARAAGEAAAAAAAAAGDTGAQAVFPASNGHLQRQWRISAAAVAAELERQRRETVDMSFCLEWIASLSDQEKQCLLASADAAPVAAPVAAPAAAATAAAATAAATGVGEIDSKALQASILLTFLDAACFFTEGGESTIFGAALADIPGNLQVINNK